MCSCCAGHRVMRHVVLSVYHKDRTFPVLSIFFFSPANNFAKTQVPHQMFNLSRHRSVVCPTVQRISPDLFWGRSWVKCDQTQIPVTFSEIFWFLSQEISAGALWKNTYVMCLVWVQWNDVGWTSDMLRHNKCLWLSQWNKSVGRNGGEI